MEPLLQTEQCEKRVQEEDGILGFMENLIDFLTPIQTLLKDKRDEFWERYVLQRKKELKNIKTCNTCIYRHKYQIGGECNEYYRFDSTK